MADEITIRVPASLDGERVDKVLATMLEVSRSQARDLVDSGVAVDGVPARPGDRVSTDAVIVTPQPAQAWRLEAEPVDFEVLYEDDSLVVVNKPPGVVVHPGSGRKQGTLAAGLLHEYPELEGVGQVDRWGLVHRLDRETSGALLVARTSESYTRLSEMLRRREVKRIYTALVYGLFSAPTGSIEAPIGRDPTRPTRRAVAPDGKAATTHYEVRKEYTAHGVTLLSVRLETGRTHQIRVHMAAIDHPVVGDRTYGTRKAAVDAPRVFLHATALELIHPVTGVELAVECPLAPDLQAVLDGLEVTANGPGT